MTGIAFIDSTTIEVCHPRRAKSHKVFSDQVGGSKNSMGWHFGFKLHLVINDRGELLAFKLTPAKTDDRVPVPEMTQDIIGKLFDDLLRRRYANAVTFARNSSRNFVSGA
ncbi:MAG: transposase [Leptolyngbyaceae cyanobacterium]